MSKNFIYDIIISLGLSLIEDRLNKIPMGRIMAVLDKWMNVRVLVYRAISDTGDEGALVTMDEASPIRKAIREAAKATVNLIKGK